MRNPSSPIRRNLLASLQVGREPTLGMRAADKVPHETVAPRRTCSRRQITFCVPPRRDKDVSSLYTEKHSVARHPRPTWVDAIATGKCQ